MNDSKPIPHGVARRYRGAWVAWDRDQTKIIASGRSFDEAKQAAARAGEASVVLGKIPDSPSWRHRSRRLIHMVAVFISLGAPSLGLVGTDSMTSPQVSAAEVQAPLDASDLDDDGSSDDGPADLQTPPVEEGQGWE